MLFYLIDPVQEIPSLFILNPIDGKLLYTLNSQSTSNDVFKALDEAIQNVKPNETNEAESNFT